ncbi:sensor histidine kinase [Sphingomonas sp.]|uniref:sensor histidine kinase n=1 Tax=Sphingomonas sp. TaxID=28214 RepID=UPI0025CE22B3|nr:sensor histidine kinase [Sphingomonas sp.]MBV9526841.1 sensor histidine kinase [Sphingomonas sp.]
MLTALSRRFEGLPTAAKLLLILTAVLLPIGIALTWFAGNGIRQANGALVGRVQDQERIAAGNVESLIARNALALRIAANGALADGQDGACERALRSLAIAPAVSHRFEIETADGRRLCSGGDIGDSTALPLVAPGDIRVSIDAANDGVAVRTGVIGGMATAIIPIAELRTAGLQTGMIQSLVLSEDGRELRVLGPAPSSSMSVTNWPIAGGSIVARVGTAVERISTADRLVLLLPVLMWILAALVTWLLVTRLLIRPLRHLQGAVSEYEPGRELHLPHKFGPSREIQELSASFGRATARVDESERDMAAALDGQRRLVREVHHRVKNNLQVVASLLNIHGRSAGTPDARAAYAGIGRRVGALSIVHRNHFAEMEENRGIGLRTLLNELTSELRASAPESARGLEIELAVDGVFTTQDVGVAVAFLVTEIIEFAMLRCPDEPVEVTLRRASELTARLSISSPVLVPDEEGDAVKAQFERVVGGLAKQLRSPLDRRFGRYSVDLPVFPDRQ